ncbi:MAG: hypothetical protein ABUT39_29035 [Acidobacteriota bacterium]
MKRGRVWAWLLASILLLGVIDVGPLHPRDEGLGLGAPGLHGQGSIYYPDARHVGQPAHVERAAAVKRPTCPLCLHHLQTAGTRLPQVATVEPPSLKAGPGAASEVVPCAAALTPSGARGPPSVS